MLKAVTALLFLLVSCFGSALAYSNDVEGLTLKAIGYRSNYFLLGTPLSKLSLSFKLKAHEDYDFYFAYSQQMFWALQADSRPFRDLNYNPEMFYRVNLNPERGEWIDVGAYEHESNGMAGLDSRSWDRSYLRYNTKMMVGDKASLTFNFKIWYSYNYDETNMDIEQYRGFWEINIILRDFLGASFSRNDISVRLYPGGPTHTDILSGGQEITYRVNRKISKKFLFMPVFQYFHGRGENLLDFREEKNMFRVGFGF